MRRRALLSASVPGAVALLSGCIAPGDSTRSTTSTVPDGAIGCPRYTERVETVGCTPDPDDPSSQMAIRPASASGTLPEASFSFTISNERDTTFNTNFYAWRIQKYVDGRWLHVTPQFWPEPLMRMTPGNSHTWNLTVDNGNLDRSIPHPQGTEDVTVVGLGGGTYSFGIEGSFEDGEHSARTAFVTRFRLEGEDLAFGPTPDVAERVREGDKVIVEWPHDEGEAIVYRVTRLKSDSDDAELVIPEQAIRNDALRNALSLFEQWTRIVELHTTDAVLAAGELPADRVILYEGTAYRIEVESAG